MTERVTHEVILFAAPFTLAGFDAPLPAGSYKLMIEEEVFEAAGHVGYRRIATTLRVERDGRVEHHAVNAAALEDALHRDRDSVARTAGHAAGEPAEPPQVAVRSRWQSSGQSLRAWARAAFPRRGQ